MDRYKISATVLSTGVLAACAPSTPNYQANLDGDQLHERVVCKMEAPFGTKIKQRTCRVVIDGLTEEQRRNVFGAGYHQEVFPMKVFKEGTCGSTHEGQCGGTRD